ncbi:(2Fe-2S)-binding protein [Anaerotalea alkaliphila]|uniref:(2Fe-2S)-binding protein n=1 Tax=Anaerotalea alkaliphila TaxID=2662126 RepID=A0A7X5HUL0_9FIRM|nr:(2Fe-2S)-binding protein [Anaerotalea alkaliphila]NDL66981.1 (2Fe-2S)-binding protein [Anaerotalea alkaliphila]
MANKGTICTTNNVEYIDLRRAQIKGARSLEELKAATGACGECEGCRENLEHIRDVLCGCKEVTMEAAAQAVRNGADTVEKVVEATGAGSDCARCKALIANVVEMGR